MELNIITASFNGQRTIYTKPVYQYNYGQVLQITGLNLPMSFEAHFTGVEKGKTVPVIGSCEDGIGIVSVPDESLKKNDDIVCYIFLHETEADGETEYKIITRIMPREEPTDIEPTPVQQDAITQAISALQNAVRKTGQDVETTNANAELTHDYRDEAEQAKTQAVSAKEDAILAKTQAETARDTALTHANSASSSATSASQSAQTALTQADRSKAEADRAKTEADKAKASADSIIGSVSRASEYAEQAKQSATKAQTKATEAETSATEAVNAKNSAITAKTQAESFATSASASATTASTKAIEASNSATIAVNAKTDAESAKEVAVTTADAIQNALVRTAIHDKARGTVATFPDGADNLPMDSVLCKIEPVQDLHGYENPWPAGGGKNLLKTAGLIEGTPSDTSFSNATKRTFTVGTFVTKLTSNNYYQTGVNIQCSVSENSIKVKTSARAYGVSIPIVGLTIGETYVLSCTKTNAGNNSASFYKQDGTFISNTPNLTIYRFTVPEETYYTLLHFDPSEDSAEASFTDIQLEKGSTPSSYVPYENICPITGWTGAKVTRTGKNLSSYIEYPYIIALWGGRIVELEAVINALPVGTYTISNKYRIESMPTNNIVQHGGLYVTAMINGTQTPVNRYNTATDNSPSVGKVYVESNPLVITEENQGKINRCYYYCDSSVHTGNGRGTYKLYDIQIELGSTATDYEPYQGNTYDITFPTEAGTVYGGTLDVTNGVLTVDRAMVDLGTLTWSYNSTRTWFETYSVQSTIKPSTNNNTPIDALCESYKIVAASAVQTTDFSVGATNIGAVLVHDSRYSDADTYKTAMDGVQLCYELAEPITYQLTPQQINTLLGTNNVWSDTGDSDVEYPADTKLYIDKKLG